jgi:hypothetical protein
MAPSVARPGSKVASACQAAHGGDAGVPAGGRSGRFSSPRSALVHSTSTRMGSSRSFRRSSGRRSHTGRALRQRGGPVVSRGVQDARRGQPPRSCREALRSTAGAFLPDRCGLAAAQRRTALPSRQGRELHRHLPPADGDADPGGAPLLGPRRPPRHLRRRCSEPGPPGRPDEVWHGVWQGDLLRANSRVIVAAERPAAGTRRGDDG